MADELKGDYKTSIQDYATKIDLSYKFFTKNWYEKADKEVQMYELNHYYDPTTGGTVPVDYDRIKVPYPYANARQILAEIYVKLPEPVVKPLKPSVQMADPTTGQPVEIDSVKGASKLNSVLKYISSESNLKREAKMSVLDGIVTGCGIIMFSAQVNSKVPRYSREIYRNIVWDHTVYDPYKSSWVARKLTRPVEDVKNDQSYKAEVRSKANANAKAVGTDTRFKDAEYCVLWDVWDKKLNKHLVWIDGQTGANDALVDEKISDKYIFKVDNDEFEVDWPFIFFINEEMLSKSWGLGDIEPITTQVQELDRIRTYQINHLKRFNRKYGYFGDDMDDQSLAQLKNPEDGTLVKFLSGDWQSRFAPIQDAPISSDSYRMDEIIQKDMQIISAVGSNALSRGVGNQPGTLGEAQIIEENADTRLGEKRDNVSEMFRRIFRLTAQFVQQYWKEEDVFLITGDGTKPTDWLEYKPQEIQGEYNYDVDPESLRDNNAVYRKQIGEALTSMTPILAQVNPQGITVLARQYLETFPNLKTMIDKILPENAGSGIPGQGDPNHPDQQLLDAIGGSTPEEFMKSVQGLPPEEQDALLERINNLDAQNNGPSNSNIAGAANTVTT